MLCSPGDGNLRAKQWSLVWNYTESTGQAPSVGKEQPVGTVPTCGAFSIYIQQVAAGRQENKTFVEDLL